MLLPAPGHENTRWCVSSRATWALIVLVFFAVSSHLSAFRDGGGPWADE
jgi:hypothetical protein